MVTTAGQIVALSCQEAKCPAFTVQAATMLNGILSELCQDYDLAAARGLYTFNFNPGLINAPPQQQLYGSGPYSLPADYLRTSGSSGSDPQRSVWWVQFGQTYTAFPIDLSEFDQQTQQIGLQSFPYWFATDISQTPPVAYFYPPPSGSFPVFVRYQKQMPDLSVDSNGNLTTPDVNLAPWFPNTNYLRRRLVGELMGITGDDRMPLYLGDNDETTPLGAGVLLRKWLAMKDDSTNRARRVVYDRRRYGKRWETLPATKVFSY